MFRVFTSHALVIARWFFGISFKAGPIISWNDITYETCCKNLDLTHYLTSYLYRYYFFTKNMYLHMCMVKRKFHSFQTIAQHCF